MSDGTAGPTDTARPGRPEGTDGVDAPTSSTPIYDAVRRALGGSDPVGPGAAAGRDTAKPSQHRS